MKRIFKMLSLAMALVMCFSVTAFAAETNGAEKHEITFTEGDMVNEQDGDVIMPREPAAPVSSAKVVGAEIKSDGYVYVTVQVAGYGKNIYATYDGTQCTLASTTTIGRPIVTGFLYEMKCAPATVGSHNFTFKITSVNSPWNTVSTSSVITIS